MKENAVELSNELSRKGFSAVVRQADVQGRTIWRVFAGTGLDSEAAARMLARLREAGYAGITAPED